MYIFLDTATEDFLLLLINNKDEIMDKYHYKGYKKKVNLIADTFSIMIKNNNIDVKDLTAFYINIGPGFFTGIRSSLVFVRTICLITQKPIFTTTTFEIMNVKNENKEDLTLDAQGGKIFYFFYQKYCETGELEKSIDVIQSDILPMKLSHDDLIQNWKKYKYSIFKSYTDVMEITPLYIKLPQIGNRK